MDVFEKMTESVIVPVVVLEDAKDAVPTAEALLAGGINTMEITFRTACAPECLREVADHCKDMCVGAGTVLNLKQCVQAVEMGAQFIVSPGFSEEIVGWCVKNQVPVIPGCVTPTEIMRALEYGLTTVKFFPANVYGGLKALKSLSAPFRSVRFLPTGGVNNENIKEFMDAAFVHAVGGSWVCPKEKISQGKWQEITEICIQARNAAKGV